MSDSEEDPRFRIPRGSSDEEIDSDLASGPPSPAPQKPSSSTAKPRLSKRVISKNANVLATGLLRPGEDDEQDKHNGDEDGDSEDSDSDESNSDIELSSAALANVTAAVTKRDLTLDSARQVEPCNANHLPPSSVPAISSSMNENKPSHSSMINHILETLQDTNDNEDIAAKKASEMKPLVKKMNRLHNSNNTKLAVPLPETVSAKIERTEAYKHLKDTITEKWTKTVIHNRKSDRLEFPLNEKLPAPKTTKDLIKPKKAQQMNTHEQEINDILKQAGVDEELSARNSEKQDLEHALTDGRVSKQDVLKRQRELAKVRSLLFHYEKKMKRIKKIKSRKYRKELKKDKERLNGDESDEKKDLELQERKRIEERITQKHKNTSKWVKRQLRRGEAKKDAGTRAAIEDQLRLHEELKKRQLKQTENGHVNSDDDDSDQEGMSDVDEEEEIAKLESELNEEESGVSKPKAKKKGIMGLRFMEAAEEKKRKDALALLKEMNDDDDEDEGEDDDKDTIVGRNTFSGIDPKPKADPNRKRRDAGEETINESEKLDGLMEGDSANPEASEQKLLKRQIEEEYENDEDEQERNDDIDLENASRVIRKASKASTSGFTTKLDGRLKADKQEENPWLSGFAVNAEKEEKNQSDVISSQNSRERPAETKRMNKRKRDTEKEEQEPDPFANFVNSNETDEVEQETESAEKWNVRPSLDDMVNKSVRHGGANVDEDEVEYEEADKSTKKKRRKRNKEKKKEDSEAKEVIQELEEQNGTAKSDEEDIGVQRDQDDDDDVVIDMNRMQEIAQAFAGAGGADMSEFEASKEKEMEKELPNLKSIHSEILPGWGAWDGAGINRNGKRKESAFVRAAKQRLKEARSNAIESRSDRHLRNVILDQKRRESTTKLTMATVPYPFQSREQWEQELSKPLTAELASDRALKQSIQRKVDVKLGSVIKPIRTPMAPQVSTKKQNTPSSSKSSADVKSKVLTNSGKHGVIQLRKAKSKHRTDARRGLS